MSDLTAAVARLRITRENMTAAGEHEQALALQTLLDAVTPRPSRSPAPEPSRRSRAGRWTVGDRRVLIGLSIRIDEDDHAPIRRLPEIAAAVSAALKAAGIAHDGCAAHTWQTWESIVRDAGTIADFDEDDESEEAERARSAAWFVEQMPEAPHA